MIALPHQLPLIEWHEGRYIPLSEGWIAESIEATLGNFPESESVPLDALIYSLVYHLKTQPQGTRLTRDELLDLIRTSLSALGNSELASHFQLVAPRVTIHLSELASMHSIELAFFDALQHKLDDAFECVVRGIRLEGIRDSVKKLHNARRWRKDCQKLSDEIVLFTRSAVEKTNKPLIDLVIS